MPKSIDEAHDIAKTGLELSALNSMELLRRALADADHGWYGVHIDFAAPDDASARQVALVIAEALGALRPDVHPYSAWMSIGSIDGEQVFCIAEGPRGEFCTRPFRHDGWHIEPGVEGLRWGDGDVVREADGSTSGRGGAARAG